MKYNLQSLWPLRDCPNVSTIIEQIDFAATLATGEMRRYGIRLTAKSVDVPVQDEVDAVLRGLVSDAFDGWLLARGEAPTETPDHEVEGFSSDAHFDVTITGLEDAPDLFLTARISRRLVG
jgi:hypothetical protein